MSTLQTKTVRLGDSATLANNFELVVPPVPDGTFKIRRQNGTEILSVDAAGRISMPGTQAVLISASSNFQTIPTGLGTEHPFTSWPAPLINIAGAFDTSTGFWTPTIAGYYQINASVSYANVGITASNINCRIAVNGGAVAIGSQAASGGFPAPSISTIVFLNGTTDAVRVVTNHNAAGSVANVIGQMSACLLSKA